MTGYEAAMMEYKGYVGTIDIDGDDFIRPDRRSTVGVTHVDVTVRNPAAPRRSWVGSFLVDTGAIDSLAPRPHLEAIGLKPAGQRVYQTADGREVTLDIAVAQFDVLGEITAGVVIFGDADAEPLLGVTALESAGLEVDPQNQRLKKLPSVRLKRFDRQHEV